MENAHGMHETEPIRIKSSLERGLMHQDTDGIMGQHEGIEFLDHPFGFVAAQGASGQALMRVGLSDDQFAFPALMIQTDQFEGGSDPRIEQRRHQAMALPVARQRRIGQRVLDHAHQQPLACGAARPGGGAQVGQRRAVGQGGDPLRLDVGRQPAQHVGPALAPGTR